jgi:transposase
MNWWRGCVRVAGARRTRAQLILRLASGKSDSAIVSALDCNRSYISRWKQRFLRERLAGLYARHRGRAVDQGTPDWKQRSWYGRAVVLRRFQDR